MNQKRLDRRTWIQKMLDYGGFTLSEIKTAVRFYELRDWQDRTGYYGW